MILGSTLVDESKAYEERMKMVAKTANQSLGAEKRLKEFGILQYIDLVIVSAEEGVAKPDKRIFEIALTAANDETQCFYQSVPDSVMRDVGIWIDIR